mmetsp:Transcript_15526/g.31901  ORF Transcript_15526/g.31901 Transcript_15526/m.31901 type:complete len:338 (-) Transcript_15526:188-1201(-)|eukprot:CAMPEP_0201121946 /NCGR_PEP_ID=MMETSP0850-20130426/5691_1 /ASSEMBLY_ACC=CAM_ASM_000622 /TAXON_ID=183588 /ORGANISM="Pseudo-nitzschia fraudulenta, Strain WWA7" /LENGTH=337 /DNA_ID=CAMNT_0047388513 /DNA_START=23 /DNA_END=1036 /DNA_ORIENTATION=-
MSFDLSSIGSDDTSVVDISALLPECNENSDEDEGGKNTSSPIHDSSTEFNDRNAFDHRSEKTTENTRARTKDSPIIPKQSTEKLNDETEKFGSQQTCDGRTIRVVMGSTVNAWQTQRKNNRNSISTTRTSMKSKSTDNIRSTQNDTDNKNTKQHASHSSYAVVQERNGSFFENKMDRNFASMEIDVGNFCLNAQRSRIGSNDKVEIIEASSSVENLEHTKDEKKRKIYTTKKCRRQIWNHGKQTSSSIIGPLHASAFVDCIAIWDPRRKVYVLEVPELVANDITIVNNADDDHGINKKHVVLGKAEAGSREWRRQDPLQQQRHAETKLLKHRKRRRS